MASPDVKEFLKKTLESAQQTIDKDRQKVDTGILAYFDQQ
jgi:hypothetical protein